MTIEAICNSVSKMFDNARPPYPQLSRVLLVCSMMKRPGLSTINSVTNIVRDLDRLGIPTGPMPDGSPNLKVAEILAITKEVFRAIKMDAGVQTSTVPGTSDVKTIGGNAGGTVVGTGTIINTPVGGGVIG